MLDAGLGREKDGDTSFSPEILPSWPRQGACTHVHRRLGVRAGVTPFYVRSFAQVVGMLTATVLHTAASAVHATRRTS